MRLIDADEFKAYIKNGFYESFGYFKTEEYAKLAKEVTEGILKDIDEQPTVEPVRRGKWEHTCVCSECGQIDYSAPNYCPNCGSYNGEEEEKL